MRARPYWLNNWPWPRSPAITIWLSYKSGVKSKLQRIFLIGKQDFRCNDKVDSLPEKKMQSVGRHSSLAGVTGKCSSQFSGRSQIVTPCVYSEKPFLIHPLRYFSIQRLYIY